MNRHLIGGPMPFRLLLLLLLCFSLPCGAAPTTVGKLTAEFRPSTGLSLSYDGIPIIRGSLLQVFAKSPRQSFHSPTVEPTVKSTPVPGGGVDVILTYKDSPSSSPFECEQRVELRPDNTVTLRLSGTWRGPEPATFEWCAAKVWDQPILGAKWRAEGVDYTDTNGTIPTVATDADIRKSLITEKFWSLAIQGRAVSMRMLPGQDSPDAIFFDGRKNPAEWARDQKVFWLGFIDAPAPNTGSFKRTIRLTFAPGASQSKAAPDLSFTPAVLPLTNARRAVSGPPIIIPRPKEQQFSGEYFRVRPDTPVYLDGATDPRLRRVLAEFKAQAGIVRAPKAPRQPYIVVAVDAEGAHRPGLEVSHGWTPPDNREGYVITATPTRVAVIARTAQGAFYGLQTLRQLLRAAPGGAVIAGATIRDSPWFGFRGAHLFVGKEALPFHSRLIDRILSRYKMNSLVLECEYTRWDSHPEIATDFSMSKQDLAKEISVARDHFMEVTPLINSLGHAEWMFRDGKNLDFAEDPEHPFATCPNREATYRFLFDVYDEALQLFKPKLFHIGHDEVTMVGRFPSHPECVAEGRTPEEAVSKLFMKDVKRVSDWLAARGSRTVLWGDMLLHSSETGDTAASSESPQAAAYRRVRLTNRPVVADWHYEPQPKERYGSLAVFRRSGIPAIATTWYQPMNIYGSAQAAIDQRGMGLLQSTWTGFDSREALLATELRQFTAFVLAAEYAWSGNPQPPDRLPYSAEQVFKASYRDREPQTPARGWTLDLAKAYNLAAPAFSDIAPGLHAANGWQVRLGATKGRANVVALAGKLNPDGPAAYPQSVTFAVNRKAREMLFIQGTLYRPGTPRVGRYVVTFENGRTVEVPLRDRDNIAALEDETALWGVDTAWSWRERNGNAAAVRSLRWKNPLPAVSIRSIQMVVEDPVAAPFVAGITGIE